VNSSDLHHSASRFVSLFGHAPNFLTAAHQPFLARPLFAWDSRHTEPEPSPSTLSGVWLGVLPPKGRLFPLLRFLLRQQAPFFYEFRNCLSPSAPLGCFPVLRTCPPPTNWTTRYPRAAPSFLAFSKNSFTHSVPIARAIFPSLFPIT